VACAGPGRALEPDKASFAQSSRTQDMDFDAARRTMVDTQIRPDGVTVPEVVDAFMAVPREAFLPRSKRALAYSEVELRTSEGRALWTPRDTAKMLKALSPRPTDVCLVIGAGAGYEAALLAELTETIIALEEDDTRVERMTERFATVGLDKVVPVKGDLVAGLPDQAPFDIILICGMVETVPETLTGQLSEGGRLGAVVQMDDALGRARVYTRAGETASHRDIFDARPPKFPHFNKPETFVF